MAIEKLKVSKCIKKSYTCGSMFMNMYTFSPYMGCSHNCLYCDGRAEKYHFEGNFARDIKVRENLPDLLTSEIKKLREIAPIHLASGISDIYQHIEKKLNLTGMCSEILKEYNFPVSVLTKSSLILRDFDNWCKVNKKGGFTLQITVNTLNDKIREEFEPGASPVEERLDVIKEFKSAGCGVGVYMQPLLPGISDNPRDVEKVVQKLADLKVDYIMPWFLTLRPGRQKDIYIDKIRASYGELLPLYGSIYGENRVSGSTTKEYERRFLSDIGSLLKEVNYLPPHYLYRDTMPRYCEVLILLEHMIQLYQEKGINTKPLKRGYGNFLEYINSQKRIFNRKSSLPGDEIDHRLEYLINNGDINSLIDNQKLSNFIIDVFINRRVFDYQKLSLI